MEQNFGETNLCIILLSLDIENCIQITVFGCGTNLRIYLSVDTNTDNIHTKNNDKVSPVTNEHRLI